MSSRSPLYSPTQTERDAALTHVKSAEKRAALIPDLPASTALKPISRAAIIGAGTMGASPVSASRR
jgi:hypothetical protein